MKTGMPFLNLSQCLVFDFADTILCICFSRAVDSTVMLNVHPIFSEQVAKSLCWVEGRGFPLLLCVMKEAALLLRANSVNEEHASSVL